MKREIKFRGKPVQEDSFVYGNLCKGVFGHCLIQVVNPFKKIIAVNEKTVGQYTGLKDKNGVEIYEGDILQHSITKTRFVIYWGEFSAAFRKRRMRDDSPFGLDTHQVLLEVIGNIYENPELLNA